MGIFSRFENKMEDAFDNIGDKMFDSPISPVQIAKKCEKEMRRGKMVGAGKQYAPTLYTILVNRQDDRRLFGYYPTLAGETETYLQAKANEQGLVMDGNPLVRFIADESLKSGKFDVVAEAVAGVIVDQLRQEELNRYGANTAQEPSNQNAQPQPQPQVSEAAPAPQQPPSAFAPYDVEAANAAAQEINNNRQQMAEQNDGFGEAATSGASSASDPFASSPQPEVSPQTSGSQGMPNPVAQNLNNSSPQNIDSYGGVSNTSNPPSDLPGQSLPNVNLNSANNSAMAGAGVGAGAAGAMAAAGVGAVASTLSGQHAPEQQPITAAPTQIFQPPMQNTNGGQPPAHFRDMASGRVYTITQEHTLIGRDTTCNLCLADVNASRQHAQLEFTGNAWVVTDLGSTNGTCVNDQRINATQIMPGDVVTIGITNLEFNVG